MFAWCRQQSLQIKLNAAVIFCKEYENIKTLDFLWSSGIKAILKCKDFKMGFRKKSGQLIDRVEEGVLFEYSNSDLPRRLLMQLFDERSDCSGDVTP